MPITRLRHTNMQIMRQSQEYWLKRQTYSQVETLSQDSIVGRLQVRRRLWLAGVINANEEMFRL
jgi:hypothetical protein